MIKAIIFDFFGVICSDEYWKSVKGDITTPDQFKTWRDKVNLGEMEWRDFLEKVAQELGQNIEDVEKMYASEQINVELVAYINALRLKYKTALLTNAHETFIEQLMRESKLGKVFDEIVISSKVGIMKPDPKIYEYVLDKLGVQPAEAIFIDDSLKRVEGARTVGLHAIKYDNFPQMETELEKILNS